ncbi:hypothetical protein GX51_05723, partial [Blastomyces parvus]
REIEDRYELKHAESQPGNTKICAYWPKRIDPQSSHHMWRNSSEIIQPLQWLSRAPDGDIDFADDVRRLPKIRSQMLRGSSAKGESLKAVG